MPVGILINAAAIVIGGILGTFIGPRFTEKFKENLNSVFGACAMTMGITSIILMNNMPAVIFAVIAGTIIGSAIHMEKWIRLGGLQMEKIISRIIPAKQERDAAFTSTLVTAIVLFCSSGTGIYGSIVSGMTGDHSILISKAILDLPTAMIFACILGAVTCVIVVPQLVIFLALFFLAGVIYPYCTEAMIGDFKACGGVLLLATGFRMIKVKEFPIADMIPAMILVMPLSALWTNVIMPLL